MKCVLEPGEVTPIFSPFRSFGALEIGLASHHRQHKARIAAVLQERHHRLVLGLHLDGVIEGADADLGAAADDRLQGAAAAGDVGNFDVEAGVLEGAKPFGHRQRQIEHRRFDADGYPRLVLRTRAGHEQRGQCDRPQSSLCVFHDGLPTSRLGLDGEDGGVEATTNRPDTAVPFSLRVEAAVSCRSSSPAAVMALRTCDGLWA